MHKKILAVFIYILPTEVCAKEAVPNSRATPKSPILTLKKQII
jgi:hypothetical protein